MTLLGLVHINRVEEEYSAGRHFCVTCGRSRRHILQARFLRVELCGRVWELQRQYIRRCSRCGSVERLLLPPDLDLLQADPDPGAAAEAAAAGGAPDRPPARGALYQHLQRELGRLLSDGGTGERGLLLSGAHPGTGGILLEYARRQARELLRLFPAAAPASRAATDTVERALEDELFSAAWAGYTCYMVHMQNLGAAPGQAPGEPPDLFMRRVQPLALKRAERGRLGAVPDVSAWIWDHAAGGAHRLCARGLEIATRQRPALERAVRDCLYLGYAAGVEEGRYR